MPPSGMYAPGNAVGKRAFTNYKKRVAKANKKANVKSKKGIVALVKKELNREQETKYVSEYIDSNLGITAGTSMPAGLRRMLCAVTTGTGDNQRVGDKIQPVMAKTSITVHFQATPSGSTGDFSDCIVHCYVLSVKGAKNQGTVALVPANSLLKLGTGANGDPSVGTYTQSAFLENVNHMPINKDQFTVLKHFQCRLAKGDYDLNGPSSAAAGAQRSVFPPAKTFTYKWKPPALLYNAAADSLPTNHYPVFCLWVTTTDGGPYAGNVYYGSHSELYYKDP